MSQYLNQGAICPNPFIQSMSRAQISKIESGKSVTLSTIIRAFKAMGVNSANLDLGSLGKIALW